MAKPSRKPTSAIRVDISRIVDRPKRYKFRLVIVCEGEPAILAENQVIQRGTEGIYFEQFQKNASDQLMISTVGTGKNTLGVVKAAVSHKALYKQEFPSIELDSVWAVYDRDNHGKKNWDDAIALAKEHDIKIAPSN